MGLDMEIRRISKPHMDDSVIYNHEDIRGINAVIGDDAYYTSRFTKL